VNIQPPSPDQTSLNRTEDMEQAVHDRQEARQALADKASEDAAKKAQQQKACEAARARVQRYNEVNRVITKGKSGDLQYSSGDDLVKLRQQAEEQANKLCNAAGGGS
jgi:macrodomain Ter protein organizer (MatP/YcbG family)